MRVRRSKRGFVAIVAGLFLLSSCGEEADAPRRVVYSQADSQRPALDLISELWDLADTSFEVSYPGRRGVVALGKAGGCFVALDPFLVQIGDRGRLLIAGEEVSARKLQEVTEGYVDLCQKVECSPAIQIEVIAGTRASDLFAAWEVFSEEAQPLLLVAPRSARQSLSRNPKQLPAFEADDIESHVKAQLP